MNLGADFDRAQRIYDNLEPPSFHDCEEDGHDWRHNKSAEVNGEYIIELKCRYCGERKLM